MADQYHSGVPAAGHQISDDLTAMQEMFQYYAALFQEICDGWAVADSSTLTVDKIKASTTLTTPVINTSVSGTAILDEDDLVTDSNTQLATQQSIKAYVDTHAAATITHGTIKPALGGNTAADSLKIIQLVIDNPATADKARFVSTSRYNGDGFGATEVGKSETVSNITMDATGSIVTFGSVLFNSVPNLYPISCIVADNQTTEGIIVNPVNSSGALILYFKDGTNCDNSAPDLTAAVDTGQIILHITYIAGT